jgi:hypothetical protein
VLNGGEAIGRHVYCPGLRVLPATNRHADKTENKFLERLYLGKLIVKKLVKTLF